MVLSITAQKNKNISCRIFDPSNSTWYTGNGWTSMESLAQMIPLTKKVLDNVYEDRYSAVANMPTGGPYIIEYVDISTGVTIGEDGTDSGLDQIKRDASLARKLQSNKAVISEDGTSILIYDDDQTAIIHRFAVSLDQKTRVPL